MRRLIWNLPFVFAMVSLLVSCGKVTSVVLAYPHLATGDGKQFARTVLLSAEYGGDHRIAKYMGPVKVSVAIGDDMQISMVKEVIAEINRVLEGTSTRLELVSRRDLSVQVKVFFVSASKFSNIANQYQFDHEGINSGFFYCFLAEDYSLRKSFVLVDPNERNLGSVLREEMVQALGLPGDQSVISESIFYETSNESGYAERLSAIDEELLHFLYSELQPGQGLSDLDAALERNIQP